MHWITICLFLIPICEMKPHNIVMIIVDDLRPLMTENANISMPYTRKLIAESISFTNAYAQQALCAPSRNSMLTGRRPDALRLYDFYSYWRHNQSVANFTTMPQFFKQRGYATYSVGKVFHPGLSSNYTDDYPFSWTERPWHPETEKYKDAKVCPDAITRKLENDVICPVRIKDQPKRTLPDIETLYYSVNLLQNLKEKKKPFFLAVGFHKPHIPLKFPKNYYDRIPMEEVPPIIQPRKPAGMPLVAFHPWMDIRRREDIKRLNIQFPMGTMPKKWAMKLKQSYIATLSYIDDLIGALLYHVDLKNTIVVLTSDHGWSLGENGLWAKYSNFDVALRVPLVFRIPRVRPRVIDTPIELVDVFPTLVDLSRVRLKYPIRKCLNSTDKAPLCYGGKSLIPLMKKKKIPHPVAISQYPRPSIHPQIYSDKPRLNQITIMGYSIRTHRYRYTKWINYDPKIYKRHWKRVVAEELYDHYEDPDEINNVYSKPRYKEMRKNLSIMLRMHVGR